MKQVYSHKPYAITRDYFFERYRHSLSTTVNFFDRQAHLSAKRVNKLPGVWNFNLEPIRFVAISQ
jgi:hypothetical protein